MIINAEDFDLPTIDKEPPVPTQIKINDEVILNLIKWDILEKNTLLLTYNYILPQPLNYIVTTINI